MEKKQATPKAAKKAAVKKTAVKKAAEKKPLPRNEKIVPAKSDESKRTARSKQPGPLAKPPMAAKEISRPPQGPQSPIGNLKSEKKSSDFPASGRPQEPSQSAPSYWQDRYGDDRLVLLIRDPYWCFAYWDLSPEKQSQIIRERQGAPGRVRLILRVYDVTQIEFTGFNAHRTLDIEVTDEASNWYINVWAADRAYCVDLGLLFPDGRFLTLLRSNVVITPRDTTSDVVDEEWMVVDETFNRLYRAAGAGDIGRSSEAITKYMLKRIWAEASSGGLASMGSEGGRPKPRVSEDFWLVVNTELIVYGATEPTAQVTIQGEPLKLNPDGTFSVRYALPDGKQVIPVKAVNAGGTQERKITPVVEKSTQ